MSSDAFSEVSRFLPADRFGAVHQVTAISRGLSGAGVFSVDTDSGGYVLRVMPPHEFDVWLRHLAILRLASERGIAPALAHVDAEHRAIVSARVDGPPLGAVLGDPASRERVLASMVSQLAALHSLELEEIERLDPPAVARAHWLTQSARAGFPAWAHPVADELDRAAAIIAADPRWTLSHNDLNPGNLLWDGARVWLIDWTSSGMTHPYYDLATISTFLQLPDEAALGLLAMQEGARPIGAQAVTFRAHRRVAAILSGLMFIKLTPDRSLHAPERADDAPTLTEVYRGLQSGSVDLQSDAGKCMFGLALLRSALG